MCSDFLLQINVSLIMGEKLSVSIKTNIWSVVRDCALLGGDGCRFSKIHDFASANVNLTIVLSSSIHISKAYHTLILDYLELLQYI